MSLTYKDAGVDIDAGDELVDRIKPLAARVRIPEMLEGIGGFAGLCALPSGMREPLLVSGTDGVGTKLEVAFAMGIHDTIGIDLVAMCVNDVLTTGARPLFFLDYFATSRLNVDVGEAVIRGIVEGCAQAGCALLGGETAEMPGMYAEGTYDLAGFAVGVVERDRLVDGSKAQPGDAVVAIASSGLHSNGYSLARKIIQSATGNELNVPLEDTSLNLGQVMLTPTRIYVKPIHKLLAALGQGQVRAMCHVTGGGLPGNLPRVLPKGLGATLDFGTYKRPPIFTWLQQRGPVQEPEMRRTFNVGVGFCIVVAPEAAAHALEILGQEGEHAWQLGVVTALDSEDADRITIING